MELELLPTAIQEPTPQAGPARRESWECQLVLVVVEHMLVFIWENLAAVHRLPEETQASPVPPEALIQWLEEFLLAGSSQSKAPGKPLPVIFSNSSNGGAQVVDREQASFPAAPSMPVAMVVMAAG